MGKNMNDPAEYGPITDFEPKPLKELKKGEYFTLRPVAYPRDEQVFRKGDYIRSEKKYGCEKCGDIWGDWKLLKGDRIVYTNFIY